jgi:hypothetical protein
MGSSLLAAGSEERTGGGFADCGLSGTVLQPASAPANDTQTNAWLQEDFAIKTPPFHRGTRQERAGSVQFLWIFRMTQSMLI